MIRLIELNPLNIPLEDEPWWNLLYHLHVMNEIRYHYGQPMLCTSGVRSKEQHLEIYKRINEEREKAGFAAVIPPFNSPHLMGCASDWKDPQGKLFDFLTARPGLMEQLDIYIEDREYTPHHCHIQTVRTSSGARIFRPY